MNGETQVLIGLLVITAGLVICIALALAPRFIERCRWYREVAKRQKWQMYDEHVTHF